MNPWPIAPLAVSDLDFAIVDYDFSGLNASSLGDLPGLETAIDNALSDFGQSIVDQTTLITSMDGDLDDLGNILTELANDDADQIIADLAALASTGDGLLDDLTALIG